MGRSTFIAIIESTIELPVVFSSLVVISPSPKDLFAKLKALSTSILSTASMYLVFLSTDGSFLGLPSAGPESLIP